jgi:hypothetical protein
MALAGMAALFLAHRAGGRNQPIKVGVLPYADATGSSNANVGLSLGQLTQAEITHSTQLEGRVILSGDLKPEQLDGPKIVSLGYKNGVDMMVIGTLFEARSEESAQSGAPVSLFGQSIGAKLHSYRAMVTIQADVYDVASGKKLDSFRITQTQTEKKVSGTVFTSLGSADLSAQAFQDSTLGKAMRKVIADLAKRLDAERTRVTKMPGGSPL